MARDPDVFQPSVRTVPQDQLAYEELEVSVDLYEHKKGMHDAITKPDYDVHQLGRMLPATMSFDSKWIFQAMMEDFEDYMEDGGVPTDYEEMQENEMEFGELFPPDVERLTEDLKPDGGKPPSLRARPWCCFECNHVYLAHRNFICDTQHYQCYPCCIKNPTSQVDIDASYTKWSVIEFHQGV